MTSDGSQTQTNHKIGPLRLIMHIIGNKNIKTGGNNPFQHVYPHHKRTHLEPSTRKVLVAPALPLPYSRMSIPKNVLLTQIAVGIEPIRYADRISITSFIE